MLVDEKCLDGALEGFQKNAGIPLCISSIFCKPYAVQDKH